MDSLLVQWAGAYLGFYAGIVLCQSGNWLDICFSKMSSFRMPRSWRLPSGNVATLRDRSQSNVLDTFLKLISDMFQRIYRGNIGII